MIKYRFEFFLESEKDIPKKILDAIADEIRTVHSGIGQVFVQQIIR